MELQKIGYSRDKRKFNLLQSFYYIIEMQHTFLITGVRHVNENSINNFVKDKSRGFYSTQTLVNNPGSRF